MDKKIMGTNISGKDFSKALFYGVVILSHLMVVEKLYAGITPHLYNFDWEMIRPLLPHWEYSKIAATSGLLVYMAAIMHLLFRKKLPKLTKTVNIMTLIVSIGLSCFGIVLAIFRMHLVTQQQIYIVGLYLLNIFLYCVLSLGLEIWGREGAAGELEKMAHDLKERMENGEKKIIKEIDQPKPAAA